MLDHWIYDYNGAGRNAGNYILDVSTFSGKAMQTRLDFISANGKFVANTLMSCYKVKMTKLMYTDKPN